MFYIHFFFYAWPIKTTYTPLNRANSDFLLHACYTIATFISVNACAEMQSINRRPIIYP